MTLVVPRTVVDTTGDPRWQPMQVTIQLDEMLVADLHHPVYLDGPLSWCAYLEHVEQTGMRPPPIRPAESPLDFDIGLATWTAPPSAPPIDGRVLGDGGLMWGWACSAHQPTALVHSAVAIRRKPPEQPLGLYTPDRKHHLAAGPTKARDTVRPASWVAPLAWWALGDPDRVRQLLGRLHNVGKLGRHGWGRVQSWDVTEGGPRDGWRQRPFPQPGGRPASVRAPHWHQTRKMPCQ